MRWDIVLCVIIVGGSVIYLIWQRREEERKKNRSEVSDSRLSASPLSCPSSPREIYALQQQEEKRVHFRQWLDKRKWQAIGAGVLYLVAIIAYLFLPSHELPVQGAVWLFALLALVMSAFLPFWPGVSIFLGVIVCAGIMLSGVQGSGLAPGAGSAGSATTATTYFNPSPTPLPTSASVTVSKKDGWKVTPPISQNNLGINVKPETEVVFVRTGDGKIHEAGNGHEKDHWVIRDNDLYSKWAVRTDSETTVTITVIW